MELIKKIERYIQELSTEFCSLRGRGDSVCPRGAEIYLEVSALVEYLRKLRS